jgi:hypothetical protein
MIISGMNLPFSIIYHDLLLLQKQLVVYFVKRVIIMVCDIICFSFVRNSVEKGLQTTDLYLAKVKFFFFLRTSLITPDLSSLLKQGTQTLKSVNLEYPSFNFFQFQPFVRIFH